MLRVDGADVRHQCRVRRFIRRSQRAREHGQRRSRHRPVVREGCCERGRSEARAFEADRIRTDPRRRIGGRGVLERTEPDQDESHPGGTRTGKKVVDDREVERALGRLHLVPADRSDDRVDPGSLQCRPHRSHVGRVGGARVVQLAAEAQERRPVDDEPGCGWLCARVEAGWTQRLLLRAESTSARAPSSRLVRGSTHVVADLARRGPALPWSPWVSHWSPGQRPVWGASSRGSLRPRDTTWSSSTGTPARLGRLAGQLRAVAGVEVEVLVADLSVRSEVERVAERLRSAERPVGLRVNNAGAAPGQRFLGGALEREEDVYGVMVGAVLVLSHAAVGQMTARGRGAILNVASVAALITLGTYSAHKAWIRTFTEGLAVGLPGTGVTATVVCPGFVHTEFHDRAGIDMTVAGDRLAARRRRRRRRPRRRAARRRHLHAEPAVPAGVRRGPRDAPLGRAGDRVAATGSAWPPPRGMTSRASLGAATLSTTRGGRLMLTEVADGVLVHESRFCQSNAVVVRGADGVLLVDAGVHDDELACLADDVSRLGQGVRPGLLDAPALGPPAVASRSGRRAPLRHGDLRGDRQRQAGGRRRGNGQGGRHPRRGAARPARPGHRPARRDGADPLGRSGRAGRRAPGPRPRSRGAGDRGTRVLVAGDMLSDVLIPMLDGFAPVPVEDYLAALPAARRRRGRRRCRRPRTRVRRRTRSGARRSPGPGVRARPARRPVPARPTDRPLGAGRLGVGGRRARGAASSSGSRRAAGASLTGRRDTERMSDWNQRIIDEFRANGGDVRTNGFGKGLVLLHHRGAKTGTERVSPVAGIPVDQSAWLVAASKGGAPDNPAWFFNLLAHPDVEIETPDDGSVPVHATPRSATSATPPGPGSPPGRKGSVPRAAHVAHHPGAAPDAPGGVRHRGHLRRGPADHARRRAA